MRGSVKTLTLDKLPAGDVTIDIEYSSLNFKDALASTGQNKIAAGYPHVPGIDCAGTVAESTHPSWKRGDRVLVHAYEFGAGRFGGYARYGRVPHDWVVRIPDALSTFEAMAIGTAGYTAAMALIAIELNGVKPTDGPVLVTGSTGGVGCLAVDLFAAARYQVAASTGKPERHEWLRSLGASEILTREDVTVDVTDAEPRHLMRARWAAAVDNVGGSTLDYLMRTVKGYGSIAVLRPGRRQHVSRHADAVPAARRQPARHRFGASADCGASGDVGAARDGFASASSRRDRAAHHDGGAARRDRRDARGPRARTAGRGRARVERHVDTNSNEHTYQGR